MTDFANLGIRFVPVDDGAANAALTDVAANSTKAEAATKKLTASQQAAANAERALAQAAQTQAQAVGQMGQAAMVAAEQQAKAVKVMEAAAVAHGRVASGAKITAAETLNLSRQFADIAVTGAMGMSPLMILIQQGPQIGETIGAISKRAGGLSAALRLVAADAWAALAPFAPFIAAGAALAAVLGGSLLMTIHELNKANGDLTQGLGLAENQLEKVKHKGITVGDVLKGTFRYAAESISKQFAPQLTWLQNAFSTAYEFIKDATVGAAKVFVGLWGAQIAVVQTLWKNMQALFKGEPLMDLKAAGIEGYTKAAAGVDTVLAGLGKTIVQVARERIKEEGSVVKAKKTASKSDPRDTTEEWLARTAAAQAAAKAEELQAQLAITQDLKARSELEKQILRQQEKVKQADLDRQIASVADDKGLSAAKKAEITAQLEAVKQTAARVATLKEQAIDQALAKKLEADSLSVKEAQATAEINLLSSQQGLARSSYERAKIEAKIIEAQANLERLKLEEVVASEFSTQTEKDIAAARLKYLDQIKGNQLKALAQDNSLANAFADLISGVTSVASAFKRADIGSVLSGLSSVVKQLAGLIGSAAGSGWTKLSSLLSGAGTGVAAGQAFGLGTGNGGADLALGLGGAALGTLFAGTGANIALASGVGAALGSGAIGAAAATMLTSAAVLGPIAAIAALAVGTLFKSKPSNNGALATLDGTSFSLSGNKRTDETSQMATAAANAILQGQSILQAAGIKLAATVKTIDIGTRDATDIILSDGRALTSAVGDAAAAAETALKAVLEGATYASEAQQKLVESMLAAGKGFDDIAAALDKYAQAQGLADQIALQIQQLTDPQAYDLAVLQKAQKEQRDSLKALADQGFLTADQFASISAQLTTLEGLQIAKVMGAANDNAAAIQSASQALSEARDREAAALQETIDRLRGFAESLRQYGASLGLAAAGAASPAALYTRTRAAFMRTAAAAATGDETAMAALQGSGEAYLSASKAYQSTSLGYLRDLAYVRQAVSATAQTATEQADAAQRQLDLMNKQVDALLKVDASVLSVRDAIAALSAAMGGKAAGGFNASGYLSKNPDVAAAYQTYLQNQTGYAVGYGAGLSATEFAQIHWDRGGMNEGRGFATGGSFTVGGTGGPDSQAFNLRLSPGEMVDIRRPDQVDNAAAEETRALREQVAQLIGVTIKMAGDMEKMQRTLTNVTRGGEVMQTEAAA